MPSFTYSPIKTPPYWNWRAIPNWCTGKQRTIIHKSFAAKVSTDGTVVKVHMEDGTGYTMFEDNTDKWAINWKETPGHEP